MGRRNFVPRLAPDFPLRQTFPTSAESPPEQSHGRHCVWRVTNAPTPFYLIGTIHSLRSSDYPLDPVYERAVLSSKRVLFEFDPKERDAYLRKFRAAGAYQPNQNLQDYISPRTLDLVFRNLGVFRLDRGEALRYRPWALAMRAWSNRGYTSANGTLSIDSYLATKAQHKGKELGGLESVDEHVAFWTNTLQLDGERLLIETLANGNKVRDDFAKTRAAWKSGNVGALADTNASLRSADPLTAKRLLDDRNLRWIKRIEAEMKTGKPTSIVAGAAHFSGPNSVVALLEKRGYKLEQL